MKSVLASTMALLLLGSACLYADGVNKPIQFPKGHASGAVAGSVVGSDTDRYTVVAKQGQTMTVAITSREKNAVFTIYAPGYSGNQENGQSMISGQTLPGASEGEDATGWTGELPTSGKYLIEVGGTRGNASYKLAVTIQ